MQLVVCKILNSGGSSGNFTATTTTPNNLLAMLLQATPTPQQHTTATQNARGACM
jgi:hypothetical protein